MASTNQRRPNPVFNFIFTYNNYTAQGEEELKGWLALHAKYAVYGHEIAPSTGTPHLQGYISLRKKMRMTTLQGKMREINVNLSLQVAKASANENRVYCTKADKDNFFECGDINHCSSVRSDLREVTEQIAAGKRLYEIYESNRTCFIQYHSGIKSAVALEEKILCPKVRNDLTVSVFYGEAGTGKSHRAVEICNAGKLDYFFCNSPQGGVVWWDGYDREPAVIIDDFKGWIKPHDLWRILDKWELRLPTKGSIRYAFYTHVFITSNYPPLSWYSDEVVFDRQALLRRLHNIHLYGWDQSGQRVPPDNVVIVEEKNDKPYQ